MEHTSTLTNTETQDYIYTKIDMTDEEIKKIARDYAEDYYAETPFGSMEAYQSAVSSLSEIVTFSLQRFSKDYCIVPKSIVSEKWNEVKTWRFSEYFRGRFQVLKELFGKDMFEEDKK